jgi:hypothetical protein
MTSLRLENVLKSYARQNSPTHPSDWTPDCPSIPRLTEGLTNGFTDDEKQVIAQSPYCQKTIAAIWRDIPPPVTLFVKYRAGETLFLKGAMERHAFESPRAQTLLDSRLLGIAANIYRSGQDMEAALRGVLDSVGLPFPGSVELERSVASLCETGGMGTPPSEQELMFILHEAVKGILLKNVPEVIQDRTGRMRDGIETRWLECLWSRTRLRVLTFDLAVAPTTGKHSKLFELVIIICEDREKACHILIEESAISEHGNQVLLVVQRAPDLDKSLFMLSWYRHALQEEGQWPPDREIESRQEAAVALSRCEDALTKNLLKGIFIFRGQIYPAGSLGASLREAFAKQMDQVLQIVLRDAVE